MDKDFHTDFLSSNWSRNIDIANLSEKGFPSVAFEPLELVPFNRALQFQRDCQQLLLKDPSARQAVLILQHLPCYTLGRGADEKNLLFDAFSGASNEIHWIDRGGEVTHHLPGQIVVYPVFDLRRYKPDLNWYLRGLEQVIIEALQKLGLSGNRIDGLTGVWVDGVKVGALGIGCKRWITQHGFSINVNCDLAGFREIIPCGLVGHRVGKLDDMIPGLTVEEVQPIVKEMIAKYFSLIWQY